MRFGLPGQATLRIFERSGEYNRGFRYSSAISSKTSPIAQQASRICALARSSAATTSTAPKEKSAVSHSAATCVQVAGTAWAPGSRRTPSRRDRVHVEQPRACSSGSRLRQRPRGTRRLRRKAEVWPFRSNAATSPSVYDFLHGERRFRLFLPVRAFARVRGAGLVHLVCRNQVVLLADGAPVVQPARKQAHPWASRDPLQVLRAACAE